MKQLTLPISDEYRSAVYFGSVSHQRFSPKQHYFKYNIGLLLLDLDEIQQLASLSCWFSITRFAPIHFRAADYLRDGVTKDNKYNILQLKQRVKKKMLDLGAEVECEQIIFAGQVRQFGIYFSPVNFFFGYHQGQAHYMLAEVSNTPWNERHYYLITLNKTDDTSLKKGLDSNKKAFHVSPFMDLNMHYFWQVSEPDEHLRIGITNIAEDKRLFKALLSVKRNPFDTHSLARMVRTFPIMSIKTLFGIYWQAAKLFFKGVPFVGHSKASDAVNDCSHISRIDKE